MNRTRAMKIGAFTIAGVVLALLALLVFADVRFWRDHESYYARFPYSVTGLSVGARVELWGVPIGDVESIDVDGDRVRVAMRTQAPARIPRDAKATLAPEGFTGLRYVDIVGGELEGPALPPGSQIDVGTSDLDPMARVARRADEILGKAEDLIDGVADVVSRANREKVARALEDAAGAMSDARAASADFAEIARSTRARAPEIIESFAAASERVAEIARDGETAAAEIAAAARDARRVVSSIATLTESAGNELRGVLFELRAAVATARSWLRGLEANPSRLLRGGPREELPPP